MASRFEIIGSSLVVTDTVSGDILLENPKRDSFHHYRYLRDDSVVRIFDTNGMNKEGVGLVNYPLSQCVDEADTPFTEETFLSFVRENLGFNTASGGSEASQKWQYTAVNYTNLTTVVAPTANEGELAYVYNGQGIWPVNRRTKGVYVYQSGVWEYGNQELQDEIQSAQLDLNNHISNLSNPHSVNKTQVGLSNVDNTSDLNKPISTPTQDELDLKLESIQAGTNVSIDNFDPLNPVVNAVGEVVYNDIWEASIQSSLGLINQQANVFEPFFIRETINNVSSTGVWTITPPEDGDYELVNSFQYSVNSNGQSFRSRVMVNGVEFFTLREEAKDSAGPGVLLPTVVGGVLGGNVNSGTHERKEGGRSILLNGLTAGVSITVEPQFTCEGADQEPAIYEYKISLRRVINRNI